MGFSHRSLGYKYGCHDPRALGELSKSSLEQWSSPVKNSGSGSVRQADTLGLSRFAADSLRPGTVLDLGPNRNTISVKVTQFV